MSGESHSDAWRLVRYKELLHIKSNCMVQGVGTYHVKLYGTRSWYVLRQTVRYKELVHIMSNCTVQGVGTYYVKLYDKRSWYIPCQTVRYKELVHTMSNCTLNVVRTGNCPLLPRIWLLSMSRPQAKMPV